MLTSFFDRRGPLLIPKGSTANAVTMPDPTLEKLQQFRWEVLPHPSYSTHMSACDHRVFGLMKKALRGKFIAKDGVVQEAIT
jgi:hypothetical protein